VTVAATCPDCRRRSSARLAGSCALVSWTDSWQESEDSLVRGGDDVCRNMKINDPANIHAQPHYQRCFNGLLPLLILAAESLGISGTSFYEPHALQTPSNSDTSNEGNLHNLSSVIRTTSGLSNLTKRLHRCRTWTVQSYSPGGATNVHSHLTHASLDPQESTSQTTSRSVQPFVHSSRQSVPILYNGPPPSPSKLPLVHGGIWTPI